MAAAAAAILALASCGSPEPQESDPAAKSDEVVDISGTEPVGEVTAGSVASLSECRDWNEATDEQRLATIEDIRAHVNIESSSIEGPALTDEEAEEAFDNFCRPVYAQGFRLYKIYARAIGFIGLQRAVEE